MAKAIRIDDIRNGDEIIFVPRDMSGVRHYTVQSIIGDRKLFLCECCDSMRGVCVSITDLEQGHVFKYSLTAYSKMRKDMFRG